MINPAGPFSNVQAHIESARFIANYSSNKNDVREVALGALDIKDCRRILDLGCAFGYFTGALRGRVQPAAQITGIDLWPGYKERYLEVCREAGLHGAFQSAKGPLLNQFHDNSFDLVLCSYALYFFPESIPEIARVLNAHGTFITITHSHSHMRELFDIIKDLLQEQGIVINALPAERLIDKFTDCNGGRLLSPWFGKICAKRYDNNLVLNIAAVPALVRYLRFKSIFFLPPDTINELSFFALCAARLLKQIRTRNQMTISKNDIIFICTDPVKS